MVLLFNRITALAVCSALVVKGVRVGTEHELKSTPCAPMDWEHLVRPNVHQNMNTPWKRDQERAYVFPLPQAEAGWFHAAIHEAACPDFARHPDGKATFNCESNGQWRLTKETCSFSNTDCFAGKVRVRTADGFSLNVPFKTADAGYETSLPCDSMPGPWTEGHVQFICRHGEWQVNGNVNCTQTQTVVQEIVDCISQSGYRVTLDGIHQNYTMPRGDFGQSVSQACKFGKKTQGTVTFTCQETGNWAAVGQQCREPTVVSAETGCRSRRTRMSIGGVQQRFVLQPGQEGSTVEVACTDGLEGTATFTCAPRKTSYRWRLTTHSCLAPLH